MIDHADALDRALLDRFQRGLPLTPRPFAAMARTLEQTEATVMARLRDLIAAGAVARVGGVIRPNALGASTLAAIDAPPEAVGRVADAAAAEPGVNHAYLREGSPNFWFVATAPDRAGVDAILARLQAATGLAVIDLPLVTPYHIDLGFSLRGPTVKTAPPPFDPDALRPGDRALAQALVDGLAVASRPFMALARGLGRTEAEVLRRTAALLDAGALTRLGVVVRHRAIGFRANAMVCFAPPADSIDAAGRALAAAPGVTLCYRRRPHAAWPWPLFCMVHARSRDTALGLLDAAVAGAGLAGAPRRVLFSTRCFTQRGARLAPEAAPAEAAA